MKHLRFSVQLTLIFFSVLSLLAQAPVRPYKAYDKNNLEEGWSIMPVRSEEEFNEGLVGGGAHQIMHGMVRCHEHPEIVYAIQDVSGPWRSVDGGASWTKAKAHGLIAVYGQSIAVDPINPARVMVSTYHPWDGALPEGQGMNDHAGIYLSEDYGETFTLVLRKPDFGFNWHLHRGHNENIVYAPWSVAEDGASHWYAAFHGEGIFESSDFGQTWTEIFDLSEHDIIYEITVHPVDSNLIYLASGSGLYVSSDRGRSFTKNDALPIEYGEMFDLYSDNGPFNPGVSSIEINPDNPSEFWVTTVLQYDRNEGQSESAIQPTYVGLGLHKTSDGGQTFEEITFTDREDDNHPVRIFLNPAKSDRLYLLVPYQYYITDDGGLNWQRMTFAGSRAPGLNRYPHARINGMSAAFIPSAQDPNDVVAHGEATFYKSTDGGYSPIEANAYFTGIGWHNWASGMAFNPNNPEQFAFFACDVGLRLTSNGGDFFTEGKPVREVFADHGVNTSYQGQTSGTFDIDPDSQTLISTIGQYSRSWLVRSDNMGQEWSMYDVFSSETHDPHRLLAWHPTNRDIIFSTNKISRDGGESFQPLPQIIRNPNEVNSPMVTIGIYGFCYHQPETVYAIYSNIIYRSDNTAANGSWEMYLDLGAHGVRLNPIDGNRVFAVDAFDSDIVYFLGTNGDLGRYDGETLTLETGMMDLVEPAIPGNCVLSIAADPKNEGVVYAATAFPGTNFLFRSEDHGQTWIDITGGHPETGMLSSQMLVNPHTGQLFCGSMSGTWVYTPETALLTNNRIIDWQETKSIKVLPNPIHDEGVVLYTLKNKGITSISVYNSQGAEVKQVKQSGQISGSHEVVINCSDLESGLYYLSINQNGHLIGAQKLIVQ